MTYGTAPLHCAASSGGGDAAQCTEPYQAYKLDINEENKGLRVGNRTWRTQPDGCKGDTTFVDSSYVVEDGRDVGITPHIVTEKTVLG